MILRQPVWVIPVSGKTGLLIVFDILDIFSAIYEDCAAAGQAPF